MNATRFRPADSPCRARFRTVRCRACGGNTVHRRRRRSNPGRSRSPTARQQLLAAQHLAGVGQKGFGQAELAGRQVDLTIAHPRPPRAQVEAEATVAERAGRRARIRVAAQPQPNPGQQLLEAERFRHVVVGTALEAGDGVGDGRSRGQHDHRRGDALTRSRLSASKPSMSGRPTSRSTRSKSSVTASWAPIAPLLWMWPLSRPPSAPWPRRQRCAARPR